MLFRNVVAVCLLSLNFSCAPPSTSANTEAVYGVDNRKDVFDSRLSDMLKTAARSTALLTKAEGIQIIGRTARLDASTLEDALNVCPTEKFAKQPITGFCSGFLIAPSILVTAGHCVENNAGCADTVVVFDYAYSSRGKNPTIIPASSVYSCKNLLDRHFTDDGKSWDYAVLELDRPVSDREPLATRTDGEVAIGEKLALIGHPSGLPTKVATSGKVRDNENPYFVSTTVDAFGGNSGSAVLNEATGLVEGVLVRGEVDYEKSGSCRVVKRCAESECRGEDVTRIRFVNPFASR